MRLTSMLRIACVVVLAGIVPAMGVVSAQNKPAAPSVSAGTGKLYIGTYSGDIRIYDEATEKLEDRIILKTGLPRSRPMSRPDHDTSVKKP